MEKMGAEKGIIKQSILKANTFIDFNKLFNLFHFLKLKIDLTASRPQRRVNCTFRISIPSAIWYSHLDVVSGGFISFYFIYLFFHLCIYLFIYLILFLRSLHELGEPRPTARQQAEALKPICKMSAVTSSLVLTSPAAKWRQTEKVEIIIKMMLLHKQAYGLIRVAVGSSGWFMLVLLMLWGNATGRL